MILAHGLGGRTDLPLPTWMVLYGGAMVLLVSFAALGVLWPKPRWEDRTPAIAFGDPRSRLLGVLRPVGRAFGLGVFVLVLVAAAAGLDDSGENIAPVVVYITFWVGVTLVNGLVGNLWGLLNPFDTMAAGLESADLGAGRSSPWQGGYWPAAAGLLAFLWLELVYTEPSRPRALAVAIGAYTVVVLLAVWRWGRAWLARGEAFTAIFGVLARGAPLGRSGDGRLALRPPFAGLARLRPEPGLEALVVVLLGATSFDGLTRTSLWTNVSQRYTGLADLALGTAGLLWAIAVVWMLYSGAMRVMSRITGGGPSSKEHSPKELSRAFVHSLVPIALAYSIAHYFSYFVYEGQDVVARASDPFGFGWDLFGTADRRVDYALLSTTAVAYVQAGAIVAGHVAGVILAHDRALALFPGKEATRSQYPLLAAMVLFTIGGLFLLLGG